MATQASAPPVGFQRQPSVDSNQMMAALNRSNSLSHSHSTSHRNSNGIGRKHSQVLVAIPILEGEPPEAVIGIADDEEAEKERDERIRVRRSLQHHSGHGESEEVRTILNKCINEVKEENKRKRREGQGIVEGERVIELDDEDSSRKALEGYEDDEEQLNIEEAAKERVLSMIHWRDEVSPIFPI